MGQAEFLNHQSPRVIPRRTGLFLFAITHFPYILALPLVAVILDMAPNPFLVLVLSAMAFGFIFLFWYLFVLDLSLAEDHHPHHAQWNRPKKILSRGAVALQAIQPWTLALIFWFAATLINLAVAGIVGSKYLQASFWLLYVPVVIWPGYTMDKKASEWFGGLWLASALVYAWTYWRFFPYGPFWPAIAELLSNLVWFLFLSVFLYYLFRRLTIFRCQFDFLQDIIRELRQEHGYSEAFDTRPIINGRDEHLNHIAWMIGSKLKFERVYIHIQDTERKKLFMKGRYGADQSPWPPEGWPIQEKPTCAATLASVLCSSKMIPTRSVCRKPWYQSLSKTMLWV
jgi:hypothetical protein